jgi:hypothetical protein
MSSPHDPALAQAQRLLDGCRKGLHHDLSNQLVALLGLLKLVEEEEAERLRPTGQDYLRRLVGVAHRIQSLSRTLNQLAHLGGKVPPSTVAALPEMVEEALAEFPTLTLCSCSWEAPRVLVPHTLLSQALPQALRLLLESREGGPGYLDCRSRPLSGEVELLLEVRSALPAAAPAAASVAQGTELPRAWHERVECLLLRELALCFSGTVQWLNIPGGLQLTLTFPAPR